MTKPGAKGDRPDKSSVPGILYVVSTPIGHLGDLSPRAAEVMRSVAVVAAEDTRQTGKLVRHVGSRAKLLSAHAHSPSRRLDEIVAVLQSGADVAVTTDAGTPGVSDPGPALVRRARDAGVTIVPIPGASAVHAALSASGLVADQYWFAGFAPRRGADRTRWLDEVAASPRTVVCFEAPGRVAELLADLVPGCGPARGAVVARELTKIHEEIRSDTLGGLAAALAGGELRGEVTIVIEGRADQPLAGEPDVADRLARALRAAGIEGRRAAEVIEAVSGLSRNESYRLALKEDA